MQFTKFALIINPIDLDPDESAKITVDSRFVKFELLIVTGIAILCFNASMLPLLLNWIPSNLMLLKVMFTEAEVTIFSVLIRSMEVLIIEFEYVMFSISITWTATVGFIKFPNWIATADEFEICMLLIWESIPRLKSILFIRKIEFETPIKVLLLKIMLLTVPISKSELEPDWNTPVK